MSSRRIILLFASIFCLGALPFLIVQPSGPASAGLSSGFTMPIEHIGHLFVLAAVGVMAAWVRHEAILLFPLSCVLLFVIGQFLYLDAAQFPKIYLFVFGAILLFALSVGLVQRKAALLGMALSASAGFHLGMFYIRQLPEIASPIFFTLGNILSLTLILATSVSFGLTLIGEDAPDENEKLAPRDGYSL